MEIDSDPSSLEDLLIRSAQSLHLNLSRPSIEQSIDYLSHLSSLPLPELIDEPNRLNSISSSLESDLSLVCFREFKSFLISHEASISIKNSFERFDHSIHRFIHHSDSLRSKAISFNSTIHPILDDRHQIALVLDHLNAFENLLELPQLISTCINHRLSNQAIDLALKLRLLDSNLSSSSIHHVPHSTTTTTPQSSNGIIHRIRNQVDRTLQSLRDQSLIRLTDKNLKLPSAIRTIVTLRRLSSIFSESNDPLDHHSHQIQPISEAELRMAFLTSRWQALSETLHQLELSTSISNPTSILDLQVPHQDLLNQSSLTQLDEDRLKFLRRWLEIWREIVGDTLSIYLDIFLNPTSTMIPSLATSPRDRPSQHHHSLPQFLDDSQTPLNFFLTQAIDLPRLVFKQHLDFLVSVSSLNSLLTQLAYCGGAFGKWGLDFTRTLCPLIVDRLERLINLRMQVGLRQFSLDLKSILAFSPSTTKTNLQTRRRSVNPFLSTNHSSSSFVGGLENALISTDSLKRVLNLKPEELDPSSCSEKLKTNWLGLFPPLARLVNSQLSALNELRLLPAAGSYRRISEGQFECFRSVNEELRKIVIVLPESRLDNEVGSLAEVGDEKERLMMSEEDPGKRAEYQYRMVIHRFILLWSRNILPFLERALRLGIYEELGFESIDPKFSDLCAQSDRLLEFIIPSARASDVQPTPPPPPPQGSSTSAGKVGSSLEPPKPTDEEPRTDRKADDDDEKVEEPQGVDETDR